MVVWMSLVTHATRPRSVQLYGSYVMAHGGRWRMIQASATVAPGGNERSDTDRIARRVSITVNQSGHAEMETTYRWYAGVESRPL